jgi:hypothetical protein
MNRNYNCLSTDLWEIHSEHRNVCLFLFPLLTTNSPSTEFSLICRNYSLKLIDWLVDYFLFYIPVTNFSLTWRLHHCRWRAAKFRPMVSAHGLSARRYLYRATSAVTWGLGFSGLIRRTAQLSCLLRHTRGYGGSILTQILTGPLKWWMYYWPVWFRVFFLSW